MGQRHQLEEVEQKGSRWRVEVAQASKPSANVHQRKCAHQQNCAHHQPERSDRWTGSYPDRLNKIDTRENVMSLYALIGASQ